MKFVAAILILFSVIPCLAVDCATVKPFKTKEFLGARIAVARFFWKDGKQIDEDICTGHLKIPSYDVRGREEEAFYCLHPQPNELFVCNTKIDQDDAEITVVPATWIRSSKSTDRREYRFHAYVVKKAEPDFYYDVFSRSLLQKIKVQSLTIEGALKTGPKNPIDGYFIRVDFQK